MIVVTGAAGFIGSCMISRLNQDNFNSIIAVDDFSFPEKNKNLEGKTILERVDRMEFFDWLEKNEKLVEVIIHLGARTDTTEFDKEIFDVLNLDYSKKMWNACCDYHIPLIYASSAATYGGGEFGYDDNHEVIKKLKPLNPYGDSKNDFDIWALEQEKQPFFWSGLKFFNVYGPNEYHKSRMASVVFHTYNQIQENGAMKLFRSHNPDYKNGEQLRDFIYVKDVVDVIMFLAHTRKQSGLYNLGSGECRTFKSLAENTFTSLEKEPDISFIDTPIDIRDKYQYFTEANMEKLKSVGYDKPFHTLEEGVKDYVQNYLSTHKYY
jgi:ADP-L-glycero-D-manno-heptose 6-epimerase